MFTQCLRNLALLVHFMCPNQAGNHLELMHNFAQQPMKITKRTQKIGVSHYPQMGVIWRTRGEAEQRKHNPAPGPRRQPPVVYGASASGVIHCDSPPSGLSQVDHGASTQAGPNVVSEHGSGAGWL